MSRNNFAKWLSFALGIPDKGVKRSLYWRWRLSLISRPFYYLLNLLHMLVNAHKCAIALDNCMRALGQMHHVDYKCPSCKARVTDNRMSMTIDQRSKLSIEAYSILPPRRFRDE